MSDLTGAYARHFTSGMVDGPRYQAEDRLVIRRIDATHASVELGLEFFNGHSCGIGGRATLEGDVLVLRAPTDDGDVACALRIEHQGDGMVFHDPDNGCMMQYCGMRGRFEGATLPYSSRRRS